MKNTILAILLAGMLVGCGEDGKDGTTGEQTVVVNVQSEMLDDTELLNIEETILTCKYNDNVMSLKMVAKSVDEMRDIIVVKEGEEIYYPTISEISSMIQFGVDAYIDPNYEDVAVSTTYSFYYFGDKLTLVNSCAVVQEAFTPDEANEPTIVYIDDANATVVKENGYILITTDSNLTKY